jgi:hypothetical protein
MKKIKNIIIVLFFLLTAQLSAQIKLASYWTGPNMPTDLASELAKLYLMIIDYENFAPERRAVLKQIKSIKPEIVFLLYSNPMEIWENDFNSRPMANLLKNHFDPAWQLKDWQGNNVRFWPNMIMMNLSSTCPKINQLSYGEYYSSWLINILNDSLVDGYFMDNGSVNISWLNPRIDIDADKQADSAHKIDRFWREGIISFLKKIKEAKGEDFIIVTNKGTRDLFFINNGVMFEKFPNDYLGDDQANGWYQSFENARRAGKYTIFQLNYPELEFGIASSLLLDNVYVALGHNLMIPESFIWDTGKAIANFYKEKGVYYRQYEKGKVMVHPEKKIGKFIKN